MAGRRQWFVLGMLGALAGLVVKLVRGRRDEQIELGRWEDPPAS